jgi:hypothetical protein
MRAIAIACGVALILATGRGFVFTSGPGGPQFGVWALRAFAVCLFSLAIAAGVFAAAHLYPRRYFHFMWWRDLALLVTAVSAASAAVALVAGQAMYGAP